MRTAWMACAGAFALVLASEPALAASGGEEVVVTAAPYGVSLKTATTSINVVSAAQLQTAPAVGLGDLLSGLPGLRSTFFGPGASRPVIRGLSGPRVLILQNSVGQIDVSDVSPDHAVPSDPQEATRIEVLRGPSTLAYGGSGIGGVVNVLDDRVMSHKPEGGLEGQFDASASTVDRGGNVAGHVHASVGPVVFSLEGVRRQTRDYAVPVDPLSARQAALEGVVPEDTRRVENTFTDFTEYGGGVSLVGDKGYIGASVRRTIDDYGVPFEQVQGVAPDEKVGIKLRQTRVDLRGEHDIDFGPFLRIKFFGGYAQYRHAETNADTGEIGTQFSSTGEEGRLELVQKNLGGWQGALGLQALHRNRTAVGDEVLVPSTSIDEYGVFLLQRLDKGTWGLEGGLRLDRRKEATALSGRAASAPAAALGIDWSAAPDRRSFTNLSGSAAVFVRPVEPLFLSLSYSHNERAPTEYELWADGAHDGTHAFEVGNPGLRPEKVNSLEGAVRMTPGRGSLEAHVFWARYDGFIQETPTGQIEEGLPVQQFRPVAARFVGMEATASYPVVQAGMHKLTFEGTYDWVRGTSDQGPVPRMPPWSLTGRAIYDGGWFTGRFEVRHVAAQARVAAFELPTDAYTMVSLFLQVKPWTGKDLKVFVEGRNLTDVEAREHTSFLKDIAPLPGRNLRMGIAYSF